MSIALSPLAHALHARPEGVEIIQYTDTAAWLSLREQDVTASVAGALLGVSPYVTAYGLHMIKTGQAVNDVDTQPVISDDRISFPPAARGHSLEPVAIQHVRVLRPRWQVDYPLNRYWRIPAKRIGCTPDALAVDPTRPGFGVVQVKTTSDFVFDKTWRDPDTRETVVPLWIAIQAMIEAKVTGASWAAVAVMMTGLRFETLLIDIPLHGRLWDRIQIEVDAFWQRIADNTPPDPDYARDGATLARIYRDSDGTVIDIDGERADRLLELVALREGMKARERDGADAAKGRKVVEAEMQHSLGNAEAARLPDGTLITAQTTKRGAYQVAPTSYRTVTVKVGMSGSKPSLSFPEKF